MSIQFNSNQQYFPHTFYVKVTPQDGKVDKKNDQEGINYINHIANRVFLNKGQAILGNGGSGQAIEFKFKSIDPIEKKIELVTEDELTITLYLLTKEIIDKFQVQDECLAFPDKKRFESDEEIQSYYKANIRVL